MKSATCPVTIASTTLFAHVLFLDSGDILRLSPDEWEGLRLAEGERVKVRLPSRAATDLLLVRSG